MSKLIITKRWNGQVRILDLAGKIKIGDESTVLRAALRELSGEGAKNILLNLADVSSIDSSGLGELVAGFVSVRRTGGIIKLINLTDRISQLMMITKLLTVFDVYADEATAVASFDNAEDEDESEGATAKLDQAAANQ